MSKEYFVYDLETRSECDLKKCGAAEYARHPTTTIFCVSWAMGTKEALKDAPVHSWSPVFGGPKHVLHGMLLNKDVTLVAHNAGFEASVTRHVLSRLLNDARLRELPPERFLCTASLASSLALPRSLEGACSAYGLGEKKDVEGRKLILKYTKPRRPTANNPEKWHNKIDELKRIIEYCENDVRAEVELFLKAYPLSDFERQLWILDQKINERGFTVDRELVGAALELIEIEKDRIEKETVRISKGEIPSTTQRDKTLLWLEANGVELPNLQAKTIRDFLAIGEGPEHCLDILRLRQAASKTSTAKYEAFEARSRSDGRSRDNLIFHGATTGRWCLPSDAEVFTPQGWTTSPVNGESIMQWDPKKDCFKFGPAHSINRFFLKDSDIFLQAKNRNITMLVTPEHRLPTYSSRGLLKTETALDRYGKATDIPISSFYSGNFLSELASRALIMVQADGHYTTNPKKGLYLRLKFRKIRKIKRCRELLEKLGVKFRENNFKDGVRFDISVKDLPDFLKQFKDKTFNFKTHIFDPAVFVDELPFWDGHKQKGLESFEYSTCNYDNALFAQTMAHLCGYSARVVSRNREPSKWRVNYRVFIRKTRRVCFRKKDWKKRKAYGKTAWCPTTDTGFFLCRYRGSIFITGNSGSGVQIQNLPKSKTKDTDQLAEILKTKDLELARLLYGDPMSAISDALRSCIIASPGKELFVVDYASIEVRVLFWLAGHEEGLKALREGKDLYVEMAAKIFKKLPKDVTKEERALGKAVILGCGYSMSAGKFFETCKMFGMDVTEELAKLAVDTYRKVHAPVVELWKKTSQTSIAAVQNKREYKCGKVKWGVRDNFLYAELPSGRRLSYYKPSLRNELTPWNEMRPVLYSWATNGLTRKFEEYKNYGGMQVENLSQAVSRDLIADAMIKIENAGFEVLLSVHDELIAERKIGESTLKEFENIMLDTPAWAEGLPIAVEGFKSARYRK